MLGRALSRSAQIVVRPTFFAGKNCSNGFNSFRMASGLVYTKEHEWLKIDGTTGTVGLSEHAQKALGDIVYVELPSVGAEVEKDGQAGAVESVKSASDIYSPVSGSITHVNDALDDDPALINRHPLTDGWLFKLTMSKVAEADSLMSEAEYMQFLEGLDEEDH